MSIPITSTFDRFAHQLASYVPSWDLSRARPDQEFLYDSVIAGLLRMLRHAVDSDRAADAWAFYTQLFEHGSDQDPRFRDEVERGGYGASIHDLIQAARLVIAGWCVRRLRTASGGTDAAERVLRGCLQINYGVPELVRIWQVANGWQEAEGGAPRATMLDRLGVSQWESDVREADRPGFPQVYTVDESWQLDGVLAMMLVQTPAIHNWEQMPSLEEGLWGLAGLRTRLESLAQTTWLSLAATEQATRVAGVLQPIEAEVLRARKRHMKDLLCAPLDEERWRQLREDLAAAFDVKHCEVGKVRALGLAEPSQAMRCSLRVRRRWNLNKQDLAAGFQAAHGTAAILARDIGHHQDVSLLGRTEDLLVTGGLRPVHEGSLRATIELAIADLAAAGQVPNLLIVPRGAEMIGELREARSAEEGTLADYGPVGSVCGLAVMKWPYTNPRSIVVCDTRALFAPVSLDAAPTSPQIELLEWSPSSAADLAQRLEDAVSLEALPELQEAKALAEVSIAPFLGLADLSAAVAIALPAVVEASIEWPAGEFKPASWFTANTAIKPGRLQKAASSQRKSKRVRSKTERGVKLYSVEDARRWWPSDFSSN